MSDVKLNKYPANISLSIIIPAKNEAPRIARLVLEIFSQCPESMDMEVIVIDDGSTDDTAEAAMQAGAVILSRLDSNDGGNPAASRNLGAHICRGNTIIFFDADCLPTKNWLKKLLAMINDDNVAVSGSLALPKGLSLTARMDYYAGWYNFNPKRPPGYVSNAPPCNLAVKKEIFLSTIGFIEQHPIAYAHEELAWQTEIQRGGVKIYFEPEAVANHFNRPGFANLLRRNYRWAYSSIEAKATSNNAEASWIYQHTVLLMLASPLYAMASTFYILVRWWQAKKIEPLLFSPLLFIVRIAYSVGMVAGCLNLLTNQGAEFKERRPKWE